MKFYITPDKKELCERKVERILSKLEQKPTYNFSEVMTKTHVTTIVDRDEYGGHISRETYKIDVIEVTIDDLHHNEWVLVATIDHSKGEVYMANNSLFKNIPAQYGLEYKKCDHCGCTRELRNKSHILYNTLTTEWMQVGSTCVSKLLGGGKYLADIMTQLYETLILSMGGCDEEGFGGWCGRVDERYLRVAKPMTEAIMVCKLWAKEHGLDWAKDMWDGVGFGAQRIDGTNRRIAGSELWNVVADKMNKSYVKRVVNYIAGLESDSEFVAKIKQAIEDQYIAKGEVYLAFFAMKMYEQSLTAPAFEQALADHNIVKGEKYTLTAKLTKFKEELCEDYYGETYRVWIATLADQTSGLTFVKECSHKAILDPYKGEDGLFRFTCKVGYISTRDQKITLRGRASKAKAPKAKKTA